MRKIFAIRDNKAADIVGTILEIQAHAATALRNFQQAIEHGKGPIAAYPEDFDLVCLGIIDDEGHASTHQIEYNENGIVVRAKPLFEIIMTGKVMKQLIKDAAAQADEKPQLKIAGGDK